MNQLLDDADKRCAIALLQRRLQTADQSHRAGKAAASVSGSIGTGQFASGNLDFEAKAKLVLARRFNLRDVLFCNIVEADERPVQTTAFLDRRTRIKSPSPGGRGTYVGRIVLSAEPGTPVGAAG